MNMTVLIGPEGGSECLDVSDDDPARRITLFKKDPIRASYKCPGLSKREEQNEGYEYGFYEGHIEIESPVQVVQTYACKALVGILRESKNPKNMIEKILSNLGDCNPPV